MQTKELITELESVYKNYFPYSRINVYHSNRFGNSISIRCFIAGDNKELSGNYWDNDPVNVAFNIASESGEFPKDTTLESMLPDNLVMESYRAYYHHKPIFHPSNVYDSSRFIFRKSKGDSEKIIQVFDKFCARMKQELTQALQDDKMHPHYLALFQNKIV